MCRFKRPCPYDEANMFSRILMIYIIPLLGKAWKHNGLQVDDLYRCSRDDKVQIVIRSLEANWNREVANNNKRRRSRPSFGWAFFRTYASFYIIPCFVHSLQELGIQIALPFLMSRVIRYFSGDEDITYASACYAAAGVCLCSLAQPLLSHPTYQQLNKIQMRAKAACTALMYQKALKLNHAALGQTQVGQITNLMSNDVARIDALFDIPYLIVSPLQFSIVLYLVWRYLGVACIAGAVALFTIVPMLSLFGKLAANYRRKVATLTDIRLRYMSEIVTGMRVIKMYCWERPFAERVADARKSEISQIHKSYNWKALSEAIVSCSGRFVLFVSFVTFILLGNSLTAEAVFVTMSLFIRVGIVAFYFPHCIGGLTELRISLKRIQDFLMLEEISDQAWTPRCEPAAANDKVKSLASGLLTLCREPCLSVEHITARWRDDQDLRPTLNDISMDLKKGDLLIVVGPVGCGKSSLLMALLGELSLQSGRIETNGSTVSYASQSAWSFNDSVRNNILYGAEYDDAMYHQVIDACALRPDLTLMPHGDQTLVGERGVQLSGGQKARINLARAVYRNSDIVLMDDPLSAVDAPVAKHIFEKCILEHLKSKIRVLVTHQIQFIQKATKILVLSEGESLAYGSFQEIQQKGIDFVNLIGPDEGKDKDFPEEGDEVVSKDSSELCNIEADQVIKPSEEQAQKGSVKGRVYLEYVRAGAGPVLLSTTIMFLIVSQSLLHGTDLFLTYWTNSNQLTGGVTSAENNLRDIEIYSGLVGLMFVTFFVRTYAFYAICMRASVRLHQTSFARLLRAPISFFDTNPAGRILNRFSKDMGNIDEAIPESALVTIWQIAQTIGVLITIIISKWILIIPGCLLLVAIYYLRKIYLKASTDIRRYDGIARSPIFSHVSTTIDGIVSIRSYGAQQSMVHQFYNYQNDHSSTWFQWLSASRFMGMVIDLTCALFIAATVALVMYTNEMAGGTAGLIISSCLMMANYLQYGVRMSADFENHMTSVERVVEYQDLAQEEEDVNSAKGQESIMVNPEWPSSGTIEFHNVELSYGGNSVLKNITFFVQDGEKIGIVGRTGAGKSSLISALFRLVEPSGAIQIDGVDTKSISLSDLRRKISIIPQDPVVFSGTVRYNLDPFDEFQDADIWSALDEVQLKPQVDCLPGKLSALLSESGSNLSVGQRQLICLARALLRRNRILVLDEATANVDHRTDAFIQQTIRRQFAHCTVLTVAHRLHSIIDSDRVLVLEKGRVVQFDTPHSLLQAGGLFEAMCRKTGPAMYEHLCKVAKEKDVKLL